MTLEKNMLISEIINNHPETIEVMIRHGLHCVGCHVSAFESLEDGCKAHGMEDEEIDEMVKEMKEIVKDDKKGNLKVSTEALSALEKELEGSEDKGLRIKATDDGFELEIVDEADVEDFVLSSEGIRIFIEKESVEKVKDKRLVYEDEEFKVE